MAGFQDHPRVGGEKPAGLSRLPPAEGSPPRGRGKVCKQMKLCCTARITPAWAGKRGHALKRAVGTKDHPRVGGEKWSGPTRTFPAWGSPPRGRGKVLFFQCQADGPGITPAWAGKSRRVNLADEDHRDHPRVGGEKWVQLCPNVDQPGSPPRGRGKAF